MQRGKQLVCIHKGYKMKAWEVVSFGGLIKSIEGEIYVDLIEYYGFYNIKHFLTLRAASAVLTEQIIVECEKNKNNEA